MLSAVEKLSNQAQGLAQDLSIHALKSRLAWGNSPHLPCAFTPHYKLETLISSLYQADAAVYWKLGTTHTGVTGAVLVLRRDRFSTPLEEGKKELKKIKEH